VAEFEQALRTLYRQGWPNSSAEHKDQILKRRFADGLLSVDLAQYLRLHACNANFTDTVQQARRFLASTELQKTKKSVVRVTTPNSDSINMIAEPEVMGKLQKIEQMVAQIQCATPATQGQRRSQGLSPRPQWPKSSGQQLNTPPLQAQDIRRQQFNSSGQNFQRRPSPYPAFSPGRTGSNAPPQHNQTENRPQQARGPCRVCGRMNCRLPQHANRRGCWVCGRYGCHTRNHEETGDSQNMQVKRAGNTPPPGGQRNRSRNPEMGSRIPNQSRPNSN